MRLKILGQEVALPTTSGTASTIGGATEIRVVHDLGGNTSHLVTILDSTGTTVGSFHMPPGDVLVIRKDPTHKLYSASSDVRAVKVSYIS